LSAWQQFLDYVDLLTNLSLQRVLRNGLKIVGVIVFDVFWGFAYY